MADNFCINNRSNYKNLLCHERTFDISFLVSKQKSRELDYLKYFRSDLDPNSKQWPMQFRANLFMIGWVYLHEQHDSF